MTQDTNTASGAAEPNLHTIQAKLIAAQNCHPNAVQILIGEALNAIDTVARAALASTPEQPVAGPANALPAAHVDNAPLGFTEREKGAWSVGYEAGASHGQAPATVQADSVLEDAARYRWLRINAIGAFRTNDGKGPVSVYHLAKIPAIPGIPEETDAAIDAARKQGEKQ